MSELIYLLQFASSTIGCLPPQVWQAGAAVSGVKLMQALVAPSAQPAPESILAPVELVTETAAQQGEARAMSDPLPEAASPAVETPALQLSSGVTTRSNRALRLKKTPLKTSGKK